MGQLDNGPMEFLSSLMVLIVALDASCGRLVQQRWMHHRGA
jgi:hypothetical protein